MRRSPASNPNRAGRNFHRGNQEGILHLAGPDQSERLLYSALVWGRSKEAGIGRESFIGLGTTECLLKIRMLAFWLGRPDIQATTVSTNARNFSRKNVILAARGTILEGVSISGLLGSLRSGNTRLCRRSGQDYSHDATAAAGSVGNVNASAMGLRDLTR